MWVILGSLAVVGLLLWAAWRTMREGRGLQGGDLATRTERAAADAARVGAVGAVGSHDATGAGSPTFLEDVEHDLHEGGHVARTDPPPPVR